MQAQKGDLTQSTPLLLLPGLMCDARIFAPQVTRFGPSRRVDVADFGDADTIGDMAARALRDAPDRFALAGHSMGARVALEIFRTAPQRVERLALISTGVHPPRNGEAGRRYALRDLGRREGIGALLDRWLPPMLAPSRRGDKGLVKAIRDMCAAGGVDRYERQIEALLARPEVESLLPRIDCPVLVVVGDADEWSPIDQHRAMAASIPGARLVVLEGCGHMAPLEEPQALNDALGRWLDAKHASFISMQLAGETDDRP